MWLHNWRRNRRTRQRNESLSRLIKAREKDQAVEGVIRKRVNHGYLVYIDGLSAFLPDSQADLSSDSSEDQLIGVRESFYVEGFNNNTAMLSRKKKWNRELTPKRASVMGMITAAGDYVDSVVYALRQRRQQHRRRKKDETWMKLVKAHENNETVEGVIYRKNKGGYMVSIDTMGAFLPNSLADLSPAKSELHLIGKRCQFFVERIKKRPAVLNRKKVLERDLLNNLVAPPFKEGDVIKGTVMSVVDRPDFVAYLRIGKDLHGILQRKNLSWHRVGKMSEELEIDQEIDVKVLEINKENNNVHLGVKQLVPDPWDEIAESHPPGTKIFAKVVTIKEYGAFVEIAKGVEGLVHASEMDWLQRKVEPEHYLKLGQRTEIMVLAYNKEKRRISLGLKQCRPNPWEEFKLSYARGAKVTGTVSGRKEDLGIFVELPGGLSGLVHLSNFSYTDTSGRNTMANYSDGQEVDVVVLDVDVEKRKVSLGIKQLGKNPYEQFKTKYDSHETVQGKVKKIKEKGAQVELSDEVTAFLPISKISEERIDKVSDVLTVGETVDVTIIEMDNKGKVVVSMKHLKSENNHPTPPAV